MSDWSADVCSSDLVGAERPEFGAAEAEVGEAEQRVVVGVQLGRQPCRRADGVEQFDDRRGVVTGCADRSGVAVGAQAVALLGGQQDHAAALRSEGSAWAASWRASNQSAALVAALAARKIARRSEEHTSELQSLMRISYAVLCLKNKTKNKARRIT